MAEPERDCIRGKTLEDQETARADRKANGGVPVSDDDMLATAVRLRDAEQLSLRDRLPSGHPHRQGVRPAPLARHRHADAARA